MTTNTSSTDRSAVTRAGIRRTVLILAACAIGSYLVFLYSVMAGK